MTHELWPYLEKHMGARLRALKPGKLRAVLIRFLEDDLSTLKERADRHTLGNVSAWVRLSALAYEPEEKNLFSGNEPLLKKVKRL